MEWGGELPYKNDGGEVLVVPLRGFNFCGCSLLRIFKFELTTVNSELTYQKELVPFRGENQFEPCPVKINLHLWHSFFLLLLPTCTRRRKCLIAVYLEMRFWHLLGIPFKISGFLAISSVTVYMVFSSFLSPWKPHLAIMTSMY